MKPTRGILIWRQILRSMLYRGSEIMREVAWVIFDEIHQLRDPTLTIPIAGRSKNWNESFWKLNQSWEQFYNPMPEAEKFFASVFPVMDRELEEFLKVQERRSPWRGLRL